MTHLFSRFSHFSCSPVFPTHFPHTHVKFPDTTGIAAIFAWRIFAKFLLHRILPPVYRFLSLLVTLPNRRFYTPATAYKGVPLEKHLRALPSVLDLPSLVELEVDGVSTAASRGVGVGDVKLRNSGRAGRGVRFGAWNGNGGGGYEREKGEKGEEKVYGARRESDAEEEEMGGKAEVEVVKHYDADGECSWAERTKKDMTDDATLAPASAHEGIRVYRDRDARDRRDANLFRADRVGDAHSVKRCALILGTE